MTLAVSRQVPPTDVFYPDSDGKPMAESDFQRKPLTYAVEALDAFFANRPEVYVSGNMFVYYEQGNPRAVVAPDVFVVVGAEKRDRKSYFLWREPKAPDWVLEITSDATRAEDRDVKHKLYARLGIQEYFQFDPTGDWLVPPLIGYRLTGVAYRRLAAVTTDPGGRISVASPVLGLEVWAEGGRLAFYDPRGKTKLLNYAESEQARREAEQARRTAERARREAERALRESEQARREVEQARLDAEARAEREAAARAALEAEIRRLKGEG